MVDTPKIELRRQLRRQIAFIRASSEAYDRGAHDESLRMAVAMRVLMHQTRSSHALFNQMGVRDQIMLLSTVEDIEAECAASIVMFDGLMAIRIPGGPIPKLGLSAHRSMKSVDNWLSQGVMVLPQNAWVTRRELILYAANKDGGAHFDPCVSKEFSQLLDGLWASVNMNTGEKIGSYSDHHLPAIRQLAYELLNSKQLLELASE